MGGAGVKKIVTENNVKELVLDWFKARFAFSFAVVQNGMGIHGIHDRIACLPTLVTQEMVGKVIGLFVSVESKRPGRRGEKDRGMSKHQVIFMVGEDGTGGVRGAAGVSICCDGEDDLRLLDHELWALTHTPIVKK